jgi:hypothetical protein
MQDWHNHSNFSDGENTIAELVENASTFEIKQFAISDHYHMIKDFEQYYAELGKYSISKSVEIYAPHIIQDKVDIEWVNKKLDFVILEELHRVPIDKAIEKISIPIIVAHPDPIIISQIAGKRIAYEINLSQGIPDNKVLQQLIDNKIKVTVGSDIHSLLEFNINLLRYANNLANAVNNGHVVIQ